MVKCQSLLEKVRIMVLYSGFFYIVLENRFLENFLRQIVWTQFTTPVLAVNMTENLIGIAVNAIATEYGYATLLAYRINLHTPATVLRI